MRAYPGQWRFPNVVGFPTELKRRFPNIVGFPGEGVVELPIPEEPVFGDGFASLTSRFDLLTHDPEALDPIEEPDFGDDDDDLVIANPGACDLHAEEVDGGGDTFDCYPEMETIEIELGAGDGWAGPWIFVREHFAGEDTWDTYPQGSDDGTWNANSAQWAGPWITYLPYGVEGSDEMDEYDEGGIYE